MSSETQTQSAAPKTRKQPSTSETGHAKNVANFSKLVANVNSYGTKYNPSNANIAVTALQTLYAAADKAVKDVAPVKKPYDDAVDARKQTYAALKPAVTKLWNHLQSCDGVSGTTLNNAHALVMKIKGTNKAAKSTVAAPAADSTATNGKAVHSTSQLSFDQRLAHFDELVSLLKATPEYQPNETGLQTATLTAFYNSLSAANNNVVTAYAPYSKALINRDMVLYAANTGLYAIADKVKKYVKGLELTTAEKNLVTDIGFKKPDNNKAS